MPPLRVPADSGTMRAMQIAAHTAAGLRTDLAGALESLDEAWQAGGQVARQGAPALPLLMQAFEQLFDAMARTEAGPGAGDTSRQGLTASGEDVSELGEYALELLEQAANWAQYLKLSGVSQSIQDAAIALARWIGAQGGRLLTLEPIVDALARRANQTHEPAALLALYQAMTEIIDATDAIIAKDPEKSNPGRPWRLLHLNRAIVATRTHQPDVMEAAFAALTRRLPEEAPAFFSQGMEQMELLNYPDHVRRVMERYYRQWSVKPSLH